MTLSPQSASPEAEDKALGQGIAVSKGVARAELVGRSPGQLMWRRFKRDRTGVLSAYIVLFFFAVGLLAPLISWAKGFVLRLGRGGLGR